MPHLVVTGAASGIGAAVVHHAETLGWTVAGLDRTYPASDAPDNRFAVDVAESGSVTTALRRVVEGWGCAPDALVHAAGVYRVRAAADLDADGWDDTVGINARGSFLMARAVAAAMIAGGTGGSLVLLGSVAAMRGDSLEPSAAYTASKGAVGALTRQLAVEWAGAGIRVNSVVPGVIDTAMTTIVGDAAATEALLQRLPLGRLGHADEVAAACMFLAGAQSSYITGTEIVVDGGYLVS